jgi:hypothetical protein
VGWGKRTLTGKGNAGIFQGQCYTDWWCAFVKTHQTEH